RQVGRHLHAHLDHDAGLQLLRRVGHRVVARGRHDEAGRRAIAEGSVNRQAGFTLIELMVSLVLFSLAMMGVLSVASSISGGTRDQRQTVAAEAAARASLDVMAAAIRTASPGVASANIQHVNTCASGALSVVNSTTAPDEMT